MTRDPRILPTPERVHEPLSITAADIRWGFNGEKEMTHSETWLALAALEAIANYHKDQLGKRVRAGQRRRERG